MALKYPADFKIKAVKEYLKYERGLLSIARDLGIYSHCTAAASFTVAVRSLSSLSCANSPSAYASYDFFCSLARSFAFGFLQTAPCGTALAIR